MGNQHFSPEFKIDVVNFDSAKGRFLGGFRAKPSRFKKGK